LLPTETGDVVSTGNEAFYVLQRAVDENLRHLTPRGGGLRPSASDEYAQAGMRVRVASLYCAAEKLLLCHLASERAFRAADCGREEELVTDLRYACMDAERGYARLEAPLMRLFDAIASAERVEKDNLWCMTAHALRGAAQATYDRAVARPALLAGGAGLARAKEYAKRARERMNDRAVPDELTASFPPVTVAGARRRQHTVTAAAASPAPPSVPGAPVATRTEGSFTPLFLWVLPFEPRTMASVGKETHDALQRAVDDVLRRATPGGAGGGGTCLTSTHRAALGAESRS